MTEPMSDERMEQIQARAAEDAHRREDRVRDCLDKILLDKIRVVTAEMVEHAAEALYNRKFGFGWDEDATEDEKDEFRELAREVLEAALGGASLRWAPRALLAVAWVLMIAAPWADPTLALNEQLILTALIIAIPILFVKLGFLRLLERGL